MNPSAWEVFEKAHANFAPPPDWVPERWRRDAVLASGRTALAVEAVLRDLSGAGPGIVSDPGRLPPFLGHEDGLDSMRGILGCSFSCGSAEVLDGLAAARRRGLATCLIGAGSAGAPDVALPMVDAPRWLQHVLFAAVLPPLLDAPCQATSTARPDAAVAFLREVYAARIVPVFVAAGEGFRVRSLLSYWLEYLHRPGFFVRFPAWTHDLFWALAHTGERRFAFLLEAPGEDLSDRRFEWVFDWLIAADIPCHRLVAPTTADGAHVGWLLDAADAVAGIAVAAGSDLNSHFDRNDRGRLLQR